MPDDQAPMPVWVVVVLTVLAVVGGFLVVGWLLRTVRFLFNTLALLALAVAGIWLYARYRSR